MLRWYFQGYADTILLATRFRVRDTQPDIAARVPDHEPYDASGRLGGEKIAADDTPPRGRHRRARAR